MRLIPTSFRTRVAIAIALLVAATLSLAAIGTWGVIRVHEDSGVALAGYRQLREVYEVGVPIAQARQSLLAEHPQSAAAIRNVQIAAEKLDQFTSTGDGWLATSKADETALRNDLARAQADLQNLPTPMPSTAPWPGLQRSRREFARPSNPINPPPNMSGISR